MSVAVDPAAMTAALLLAMKLLRFCEKKKKNIVQYNELTASYMRGIAQTVESSEDDACTPLSVLFTATIAVDSGTYCDVVMLCVAPVTFAYAADPTPHIAVLSADCTVLVNVVCVLLLAYTCVLL